MRIPKETPFPLLEAVKTKMPGLVYILVLLRTCIVQQTLYPSTRFDLFLDLDKSIGYQSFAKLVERYVTIIVNKHTQDFVRLSIQCNHAQALLKAAEDVVVPVLKAVGPVVEAEGLAHGLVREEADVHEVHNGWVLLGGGEAVDDLPLAVILRSRGRKIPES